MSIKNTIKKAYNWLEEKLFSHLSSEKKMRVKMFFIRFYDFLYQNVFVYFYSWSYMLRYPNRGKNIFISCLPKSGSTYTQKVLEQGLPAAFAYYHAQRTYGYDLTGRGLFCLRFRCSVQRIHMHANELNLQHLVSNGIRKYLVLLRDPRDVLVSYYHHVEKEGRCAYFVHLTDEYFKMSKEDKISYLIRYFLPRAVDYIHSWDSPQLKSNDYQVCQLYYRDMLEKPQEYFEKILDFFDIPRVAFNQEAIQFRKEVRFRKGVAGEWKEYFTKTTRSTSKK